MAALLSACFAIGAAAPHVGPPIWTELFIDPGRVGLRVSGETPNIQTCFGLEEQPVGPLGATMEAELRDRFAAYFRDHALIRIDGTTVAPELTEFNVPEDDPDEAGGPLVLSARLEHAAPRPDELPRRVSVRWDDYAGTAFQGMQLVTVLIHVNGKPIEGISLTPEEPEYVWHAPFEEREEAPVASVPGQRIASRGLPLPAIGLGLLALALPLLGRRWPTPVRLALLGACAVGAFALRDVGRVHWGASEGRVALPDPQAAEAMFTTLHRNIYRAFDATTEDEIYALLSESIAPELLDELYADVYESLVMREQGGAVCRVDGVEVLERAIDVGPEAADPRFTATWHWRVHGLVAHWGHIHRRTNEYRATYGVRHDGNSWKIASVEIHDHQRVESDG